MLPVFFVKLCQLRQLLGDLLSPGVFEDRLGLEHVWPLGCQLGVGALGPVAHPVVVEQLFASLDVADRNEEHTKGAEVVLDDIAFLEAEHVVVPGLDALAIHASSIVDQVRMPVVSLARVCHVANFHVVELCVFGVQLEVHPVLVKDFGIVVVGRHVVASLQADLLALGSKAAVVDRVNCNWCKDWYVLDGKDAVAMDCRWSHLGFWQEVMVHFVEPRAEDTRSRAVLPQSLLHALARLPAWLAGIAAFFVLFCSAAWALVVRSHLYHCA